jgi:hypothetical protein
MWKEHLHHTSEVNILPIYGSHCATTMLVPLTCAAGFKDNLFAKDFKKQVLAADALKAWLQDSPDEVRDCDECDPACPPGVWFYASLRSVILC